MRRIGLTAALSGFAVVAISACGAESGTTAREQPSPSANEMSAHGGRVCPPQLPGDPTENYGFGIGTPATEAPDLPEPEEAWVCAYSTFDTQQSSDGASYAWKRLGPAQPVPETHLATLTSMIGELIPAESERACTAELGPRWLLVYRNGEDLTGVVVDDFGCSEVRLTDEPFTTPPGRATQPGTVSGVLASPEGLRDLLRALGSADAD